MPSKVVLLSWEGNLEVGGGPVYPPQVWPPRPDNSLPGYGRPDNSLPGMPPGAVQLPVFPWDPTYPDNSLPGGGTPDNSLPGGGNRPDQGLPQPGKKYVVKYLACMGLILVPDNSLPDSGGQPK